MARTAGYCAALPASDAGSPAAQPSVALRGAFAKEALRSFPKYGKQWRLVI
jgi:hypothetical protein